MERKLGALKNGRVFNYAGVNWVKLDDLNGGALVLSADSLFRRAFDTEGKNNFAVSSLNRELNGDFLEALCREGAKKEDFVPLVLDLTSDDGMKDYGVTSAMIGLLTCEQFRKYRALIPNLNEEDWWWLLTPDSCLPQYGHLVRGVLTDGALSDTYAYDGNEGVRPLCILKYGILVSVEPEPGEERAAEMEKQAKEAIGKIKAVLDGLSPEVRAQAAKGALNAFARVATEEMFRSMFGIDPEKMRPRAAGEQKEERTVNNYQQITKSMEALGAFLRSLPVVEGPWDTEFQARFCAVCPAENCDSCPHGAARNNPVWWLGRETAADGTPEPLALNQRKTIGLNTSKFEFLLLALHEVTAPLIGKETFQIIAEKDTQSPDIRITYKFPE